MKPPQRRAGGITLSFLDVLSCGLGAAVVLFLIYAAMPRTQDQHTQRGADSGRRELVRGVVQEEEEEGLAVAVRSITVQSGAEEPSVIWGSIEDACMQRVHVSRGRTTFLLVCPEGLRPSRRATATLSPATAAIVSALLVDGPVSARCELESGTVTGASTVVFAADDDEPQIRVGPPGGLRPCSATIATW